MLFLRIMQQPHFHFGVKTCFGTIPFSSFQLWLQIYFKGSDWLFSCSLVAYFSYINLNRFGLPQDTGVFIFLLSWKSWVQIANIFNDIMPLLHYVNSSIIVNLPFFCLLFWLPICGSFTHTWLESIVLFIS